jgi:cysteinyl-tRNA synthetase
MDIQFFNSLTNKKEPFRTVEEGVVRMYSCGPTVYDFAHIGNFRSFLFSDVIRRFLEFAGYEVRHIMNITDVGHMTDDEAADGGGEDKMEKAMQRIKEDKKSGKVPEGAVENPNDPYQIADYYTEAFLSDGRELGMKIASEYPEKVLKATLHIKEMQDMIAELIARGHAYVGDDDVVYYAVESFGEYGELSGNSLEKLISGAGGRISDSNQSFKRHPADFMLWKPDPTHVMKWDSPWGTGYPGWHVECSSMARSTLGDVIDIHTGGEDLIFPHHECEIAQSRGATGKGSFANFWMHARFLLVDGGKMSKSKGNFYTARDVYEGKVLTEAGQPSGRQVNPAVLRYELIKSHYGSNMNFTLKGLQDSAGAVKRLQEFHKSLMNATGGEAAEVDHSHPVVKAFGEALADDLNMAGAMGAVLPWAASKPDNPHEALGALRMINHVLGVAPMDEAGSGGSDSGADDISVLCKQLDEARANKDYDTADRIRQEITDAGYDVKTSPDGTIAEKRLA